MGSRATAVPGLPGRTALLALAAVVGLLLPACTGDAEPAASSATSPARQTSVAEHGERSDALFERVLTLDEPGCSAAVGKEGVVVWTGARGMADLSTGRPIETSTTFAVGAVSMQFTATAVLLLAHEGRLSLDDPLSAWLPYLPSWAGQVTVGQAMHHVSGIPDYVDRRVAAGVAWTDARTVTDTLSEISAYTELSFPPGDRFGYSLSDYVLLGEVVRAVAGRPLQDVVPTRIFEPLGLTMQYDPSGWSPDSTDPSAVRGYVRDPVSGEWAPGGVVWETSGDAGIQTTPSELVRWADNYRTGEVGGSRLLADVLADGAKAGTQTFGAGIFEGDDGHLGHTSVVPGHLAYFFVSADRRTELAIACNGDRGAQSAIDQLGRALRTEWAR